MAELIVNLKPLTREERLVVAEKIKGFVDRWIVDPVQDGDREVLVRCDVGINQRLKEDGTFEHIVNDTATLEVFVNGGARYRKVS